MTISGGISERFPEKFSVVSGGYSDGIIGEISEGILRLSSERNL